MLTIVGVLGLWLAPAALAHHPIVSGQTQCLADGTQKVTWTVTNSESVSGSNRTMTIDAGGVHLSQGTISGISAGQSYAPTPGAGSTKTGTSMFGGKVGGNVTLSITASWSNNGPQHVTSETALVNLKSDCPTPPDPSAQIEQNCDDGAKITLKNNGDTAASFDVFKNNSKIDTVAVPGKGTVVKKYAMNEDETSTFRVTSGTYDSGNTSLTNNCTNPGATISNSCTDGGAKVVLTNLNAIKSTTFDVFKNGNKIDTVTVSAGATVTKTYAMNEDETATFKATAGNYNSGDVSVTHDCTNPKAVIVQSCDAGGAKLTLTNTGQSGTSFDIFKNGNKIDTVTVSAGATVTKTYAMNEDETATFRANADGYDSGSVSLTKNCTNPNAVIAQSCDAGGAKLTLTNLGAEKATSFDVFKNGTKIDTVSVGAGATVTKSYAMGEDETATFRAKAGDYDSQDVSLTNNCTNPNAVIMQSCDAGGAKLTLTNLGAEKATSFDVFKNGTKIDTVSVGAGATVTKSYAMGEDETATFKATSGSYDSGPHSLTNNCTNPGASATDSCADGGAKVTLTNANAIKPVTFQIFKNGTQVGDDVVVAPSATVTRIVRLVEDVPATIKVTGTDFAAMEKSITLDCTNPAALVAQDCAEGGAVFNLSNTGVLAATFQIFKNGTQVGEDVIVVAEGATKKVVAMAEDEKSTFQVKTTDGFESDPVELVNNCTSPGAVINQACSEGGAVISLSNTGGELPISFDIFKDGAKIDTVAVAADDRVENSYTMTEDETAQFRAVAGAFDSGLVSLTNNCTEPGAAIVQSCTAGGAFVAMVNRGESIESFTVAKNGTTIDTVAVAAASSVNKTYAMTEDETATYRATTADGFDSGVVSLTHDCTPTEVLGVQFEAPRSLPRTGGNPFPLSFKAFALLGLGVVILRVRVLLFGRSL